MFCFVLSQTTLFLYLMNTLKKSKHKKQEWRDEIFVTIPD